MKISEMSDDEASAALLKAYRGACDSFDPDEHGTHPSRDVNRWIKIAATGGQGSERQIADSEADEMPTNPNGMDGQFSRGLDGVPRFTTADGKFVVGDAALVARARQSDPRKVRAMSAAVPGYSRLK